jgi:hypothetical protein
LQGIVVLFIIIIIVAGVGAFWFYYREQPKQNTATSATPTPSSGAPLQTPTPTLTPTTTNGTNLVGLNVGDTFTYKLTGNSVLFSLDATSARCFIGLLFPNPSTITWRTTERQVN